MKKKFKKPRSWSIIAVTMLVMLGCAYLALSTDAFIDVGVVDAMATHDLSMYDQQRMRRYSKNILYGVFNEEESTEAEDGTVPPDSDTGGGVYNPETSTTPVGALGNDEVYNKLVQNGIPDGKAKAMSYAYSKFEPAYGPNFAIGLMANIFHEGKPGLIEYGTTIPNWDGSGGSAKSTSKNPLIVSCKVNAQALIDIGADPPAGTGSCQWSYGRRVALAQIYLALPKDTYSYDDLVVCEIDYMFSEFNGSYASVVSDAVGKSAAECAKVICKKYEKPANFESKQHDRAKTADLLVTYLS